MAHIYEEKAEAREGVRQPVEHYADHWFDHSEPPKAFLDREQALRNQTRRSATGLPAKPAVDPALKAGSIGRPGPVATLERLFKVDRLGLARLLYLPMKYLAEVVNGTHSTHRLRAAVLDRFGLDIDALPATYARPRRPAASWLERSLPKEEDGDIQL